MYLYITYAIFVPHCYQHYCIFSSDNKKRSAKYLQDDSVSCNRKFFIMLFIMWQKTDKQTYTRLAVSFPGSPEQYLKPFWILMKQEMMGWQWHPLDHDANHLQLAADRQPLQHFFTQFLQAGCSSWRPANGVKALKARMWQKCTCRRR